MSEKINYTIRRPDEAELLVVQALRHTVLDPEREFPSDTSLSEKDFDERTIHMAAFIGEQIVSTVRINSVHDDRETHYMVRKMATLAEYRNKGIGARVLATAERAAIENGAVFLGLDSRERSIPFYIRQGYKDTGLKVEHGDGVPNFRMIKSVHS